MPDLIPNNNQEPTLDSREVSEMTGKRHDHLLRDIGGYVETLSKSTVPKIGVSDFFTPNTYKDATGRVLPCYRITKKGCEFIGNKLTGEKGILFTAAYVTKFNEMEKQQFKIPQSYSEALREIADKYDQNQKLLAENETLKPKAAFFDAVTDSKDTLDMAQVAKVLNQGIGRTILFRILREEKVLRHNNEPYQEYIDNGWFRIIEQPYEKPDGSTHISVKTVVYQKGVEGIRKILEKRKSNGGLN